MGRQAKLKQARKEQTHQPKTQPQPQPQGDLERMTHLGYGEHNRLRSPEIPQDRPEPRL